MEGIYLCLVAELVAQFRRKRGLKHVHAREQDKGIIYAVLHVEYN